MKSMMPMKPFIYLSTFGVLLSLGSALSWASPVSTRLNKVYKELVIQGERPEISSCMALAFKSAHENGPYEQIYYPSDVQDFALVQEGIEDGHLVKVVTLYAQGQARKSGFYLGNPLKSIEIICTQMDEGIPVARFKQLGKE